MVFDGYEGKNVVVTGAASGMGLALTNMLVGLGANVTAGDIRDIDLEGVNSVKLNLMNEEEITSFVDSFAENSIYALFCCAGLPQTFSAEEVIDVNFLGTRKLCESILPKLESNSAISVIASMTLGWPQHINDLTPLISSASMQDGRDWVSQHKDKIGDQYMFSKEALAAWVTITATRWIQRGVRLNCLCPGVTETPMLPAFKQAVPEAIEMLPQPMARPSTAEEQAFALLYMNHPKNSALVGHCLYNDGGTSAAIMSAVAAGLMPV